MSTNAQFIGIGKGGATGNTAPSPHAAAVAFFDFNSNLRKCKIVECSDGPNGTVVFGLVRNPRRYLDVTRASLADLPTS